MPMMLHELIGANDYLRHHLAPPLTQTSMVINTVTAHSSSSAHGTLFVAKKGATATSKNGHDFIDDAITRGASAIVVDQSFTPSKKYSVPLIVARNSEEAYAHLCEAIHDFPSRKLSVIGITGTNGKTSTSFMLHAIIKAAGFRPKIMGTLGIGDPGQLKPLSHTTMEPEFISRALANFLAEGISHVIMEVSSHALSLYRVAALNFAAVGLSNITQDHLDFHGTLLEYKAAKVRLFNEIASAQTKKILPVDNPFGSLLKLGPNAHLSLYDPHQEIAKNPRLLGDFHRSNANLARSLALSLGIDEDSIKAGLALSMPIPGRLELIAEKPCPILIDYAHTPDALESVLNTVNRLKRGQIILVMGCGGDRDALKRPLMGQIAYRLADQIIVTDDNPRCEDPDTIRQQIIAGLDQSKLSDIAERKMAIEEAIRRAQPDDIVLVTGKGHEDYQIYGHEKRPFSDQETVKRAVEKLWRS